MWVLLLLANYSFEYVSYFPVSHSFIVYQTICIMKLLSPEGDVFFPPKAHALLFSGVDYLTPKRFQLDQNQVSVFMNFSFLLVSREGHRSWNYCTALTSKYHEITGDFFLYLSSSPPSLLWFPTVNKKSYGENWQVVETGPMDEASQDFNLLFPFCTAMKSYDGFSCPPRNP